MIPGRNIILNEIALISRSDFGIEYDFIVLQPGVIIYTEGTKLG